MAVLRFGLVLLATAVATVAFAASSPVGHWKAEAIDGKPVTAKIRSELDIGKDGRVAGTGGCNRMMGQAKIDGDKISFGPLAGTMMMCGDPVMAQEKAFLTALGATQRFELLPGSKLMLLFDAKGAETLKLKRF